MDDKYKIEVNMMPAMRSVERLASIDGGKGEKYVKRILRASMMKGRKEMVSIARNILSSIPRTAKTSAEGHDRDPRQAFRAVKMTSYKRIIGASLSILSKRKAGSTRSTYLPPRRLRVNHRGGNRGRERSARTQQIDSYYGSDRGFVLRFINSGTGVRSTRYGSRGAITGVRGWVRDAEQQVTSVIESDFCEQMSEVARMLWNEE